VRVLVTGAGGFVGGHLLPRLAAAGHEPIGRDRDLDVTDPAALEAALDTLRPEAVIHLAAQASVAASARAAEATFRVNLLGSRALLEAIARRAPSARVVWVGSGEVYGVAPPGTPPFGEDAPLRPRSAYARTKASADLLAGGYAARGLDVVRARPFAHSGPGQSDDFVLPSFSRQLAEIAAGRREARLAVGNLDSVRDFLDVEDVVEGYLRLLDREVPARAYNLASGTGRRIGDVLESLMAIAGVRPEVKVDPERFRPTDHGVGSAARLRRATGWEPRVSLEVTLERLFRYWSERTAAA
jgi:GDP-4-dehydro-6-deoxy-D-mannose reductase